MLPRLRLRWFFPTGFRRQTRTASRCVQRRYSPLRLPKNALHPSVSDCGSRSDAAALNLLHAAVYRAVRVGSVNALRTRTDCRIAGYGSEIDIHLAAVKQCLFGNAVVDNVNNAAAFDNSLPRRSRNFLSAAAGNDGADTGAAVIHLLPAAGNLRPFGNPAGQNFLQAADYGRIFIGTGNILTAAAQYRSLTLPPREMIKMPPLTTVSCA